MAGGEEKSGDCYAYLGGGSSEAVRQGFAKGQALLKFSAKWCGPCREIYPRFIDMAQGSSTPCYHVDIENDPSELSKAFKITKLPTFLLLREGVEVLRVEGACLDKVATLLDPPS